MYISMITIENFRCFGEGKNCFELYPKRGLTALVGENEAGKTAVIDALRLVLGTTDQEWLRLVDSDFRKKGDSTCEIRIVLKFEELNAQDKRAFVEYLTYDVESGYKPILYINWTAKDTGEILKGRPYRRVEVHSGKDGNGPAITQEARELLQVTYLRPLRDAEQVLSGGRGSRLARILQHAGNIKNGEDYYDPKSPLEKQQLSVIGISNLVNDLLGKQTGVVDTNDEINENLKSLLLQGEKLKSNIKVCGTTSSEYVRLREMLEKLDVSLDVEGKPGLGSNNILFIACELLLLAQEKEGNNMLLIEEPEAHLHPQRQLKMMKFLQEQSKEKFIQIIVTTHSPNLASTIKLNNIVMIHDRHAFSMKEGVTELDKSDYRFLERFLDVTKANLFFAKGVMVVEGDSENILLPTLAKLLGRDFTEHGVSIVNVGGVGLRRYARIFQRKDVNEEDKEKQIKIPVACITDLDVMPDCAPTIIGRVKEGEKWEDDSKRRWKAKKDFDDKNPLEKFRKEKESKASGQYVETFVSDEWTLEYNLALGPKDDQGIYSTSLAEDVFVSAYLAMEDDSINTGKKKEDVENEAVKEYKKLKQNAKEEMGCSKEEVIASKLYAKFVKDHVSKAVAAQYLAERLQSKYENGKLTSAELRKQLPKYIIDAIDYVTGSIK